MKCNYQEKAYDQGPKGVSARAKLTHNAYTYD